MLYVNVHPRVCHHRFDIPRKNPQMNCTRQPTVKIIIAKEKSIKVKDNEKISKLEVSQFVLCIN